MDETRLKDLTRKIRNAQNMLGQDIETYCVSCNKVYKDKYFNHHHKNTEKHNTKQDKLMNQLYKCDDDRCIDILHYINVYNH